MHIEPQEHEVIVYFSFVSLWFSFVGKLIFWL